MVRGTFPAHWPRPGVRAGTGDYGPSAHSHPRLLVETSAIRASVSRKQRCWVEAMKSSVNCCWIGIDAPRSTQR